jgi:hypothetical protein
MSVANPARNRAARGAGVGARLWAWCKGQRGKNAVAAASADARLKAVRLDFYAAVRGIRTPRANELALRLLAARAASDLWHLRGEVFTVVAVQLGEGEARSRMARLNRHFPTRAPLSGFAPHDDER